MRTFPTRLAVTLVVGVSAPPRRLWRRRVRRLDRRHDRHHRCRRHHGAGCRRRRRRHRRPRRAGLLRHGRERRGRLGTSGVTTSIDTSLGLLDGCRWATALTDVAALVVGYDPTMPFADIRDRHATARRHSLRPTPTPRPSPATGW